MGFWCYWITNLVMHSTLVLFMMTLMMTIIGLTVQSSVIQSIELLCQFYLVLMISIVAILLLNYVLGHLFKTKAMSTVIMIPFILVFIYFLSNLSKV